jgi:Family of unknown function (DUF6496)
MAIQRWLELLPVRRARHDPGGRFDSNALGQDLSEEAQIPDSAASRREHCEPNKKRPSGRKGPLRASRNHFAGLDQEIRRSDSHLTRSTVTAGLVQSDPLSESVVATAVADLSIKGSFAGARYPQNRASFVRKKSLHINIIGVRRNPFMRSKSSKRKYGPKASSKVKRAVHEWKRGKLKSGGSGETVRSRKQAIAIGLSEARRTGAKVPQRHKPS